MAKTNENKLIHQTFIFQQIQYTTITKRLQNMTYMLLDNVNYN